MDTQTVRAPVTPRKLGRRVRLAAPEPGFAGPGHTAVPVVAPSALAASEPTVQHGPFVAGSMQAIQRMFQDYRAGRFTRISDLDRSQPAALA